MEWPLDAPQNASERAKLIAARDKIDAGWETIPQAMREPLADAMEISTAIATRALAEAEKLRRRRDDLLEANDRYLQRARDAEALLAKGVTAVEEMIAEAGKTRDGVERLTEELLAAVPRYDASAIMWSLDGVPLKPSADGEFVKVSEIAQAAPSQKAGGQAPIVHPAVDALKNAIEGECEGLAIDDAQAEAILAHVAPFMALTPAALADALECFWNAALNNAHNEQDRTALATVGSMAEGFAAIANRLREQEAS